VLIREAFKGLKCAHNLLIVQDGEKAIQFIERIDQEESVACPSLLLAGSQLTKTKRHRSTSAPSAKPEVRQEVVEDLLG